MEKLSKNTASYIKSHYLTIHIAACVQSTK